MGETATAIAATPAGLKLKCGGGGGSEWWRPRTEGGGREVSPATYSASNARMCMCVCAPPRLERGACGCFFCRRQGWGPEAAEERLLSSKEWGGKSSTDADQIEEDTPKRWKGKRGGAIYLMRAHTRLPDKRYGDGVWWSTIGGRQIEKRYVWFLRGGVGRPRWRPHSGRARGGERERGER